MKLIKRQAATESARRIPMRLSDAVTGADRTGLLFSPGEIRIHKNGAAAFVNATGQVVEIGAGDYDYIPTQAEVDTLGSIRVRPFKTGVAPAVFVAQVVAFDPEDANAMGMTRLDILVSSIAGSGGGGGGGDLSGITALLERLTADRAAKLDNIDRPLSTLATSLTQVLDRIPAALVDGRISTALDETARNQLADALLDRANSVEVGLTVRQALRAIAAVLVGNSTDTGTSNEKFMAAKSSAQIRVASALDANNNRTVNLDVT